MINRFKSLFSKINISLFIFIFINFIFCIKYLSRITSYYLIISVAIVFIYLIIWRCKNLLKKLPITLSYLTILLLFAFVCGSFFIFNLVSAKSLNVDRWSVITSFWDCYFNNQYVYFAKSNVGNPPGPMPFYFILALPFYYLGELGWFSVMGIVLFYMLLKYAKISILNLAIGLVLISSSIFYLWEVTSRSNIFINSSLVLFVLYYYLSRKKLDTKNILAVGLLIGLSISTRNVLIIPFITAFVYQLKKRLVNPKQFIVLGFISIFTFVTTFIPFVFNHYEDFKIMNPFIIQSTALVPFKYTLMFLILAFISGLFCTSIRDIYFYSGLILFISIIIYFIYHINLIGFQNTFFNSDADISYFILCIPFFLFYILQTEKSHSN